jgi:uncharacterized membrane protein
MDLGNITVSVGAAVTVVGGLLRAVAPAWLEQQIKRSDTVKDLRDQLADAARVHHDLAKLNGTLEVIASNTEATHRATVQLGEKVGELAERVAAVEAVQATPPTASTRRRK